MLGVTEAINSHKENFVGKQEISEAGLLQLLSSVEGHGCFHGHHVLRLYDTANAG